MFLGRKEVFNQVQENLGKLCFVYFERKLNYLNMTKSKLYSYQLKIVC